MRSLFENKHLVLLFAALALGALTVLAISLNQVPFREGQQFGQKESAQFQESAEQMSEIWIQVPLWKQIVLLVLLVAIVILIGLLMTPEMRKKMFRLLFRMAFTVWAVYFLMKNYGDRLFDFSLQGAGSQPAGQDTVPLPVFEPPQVSPAFSYLVSFAFALISMAVMWGLYRGWNRYQQLNTKKPLDDIAKIARSSLDDLSAGLNSGDVIINCYLRMSDVVSSKRHLRRGVAMTPHEFSLYLEQAGLPGDAVGRLTRLFEAVRYGDRKSAPRDITEAVSCLKTILRYCGEAV